METLQNKLPAKFGMKDQISLTDLCESLQENLGDELESMILYGNAALHDYHPESGHKNVLVVVDHIDTSLLGRVMKPVHKAKKMGFETTFTTKENLVSSTDVFPIKYQSMRESYAVVYGDNVLKDLEISRVHIRLRCEQELRELSQQLEQHFMNHKGKLLKEMMVATVSELIETLRVAVMLKTKEIPAWRDAIDQVIMVFKVDGMILKEIMVMRNEQLRPRKKEIEDYYNRYLKFVNEMVQIVDQIDG